MTPSRCQARGTAVLFYDQLPSGRPDPTSEHGGCPVLNGTKWAANLWVWSGQPLSLRLSVLQPRAYTPMTHTTHDNIHTTHQ